MSRSHTPLIKIRLLHPSHSLQRIGQLPKYKSSNALSIEKKSASLANGQPRKSGSQEATSDRDLILSILNTSPTKRDAKAYLSRFTTNGINADTLAANNKAELHIAIIKLRAAQSLDLDTAIGIAQTISQLSRLGLRSVLVLDEEASSSNDGWRSSTKSASDQADRYVSVLASIPGNKARRLDYVLGVSPILEGSTPNTTHQSVVEVQYADILFQTLRNNTIAVIPPIAYITETQRLIRVDADEIIPALTRRLTGLSSGSIDYGSNEGQTKDRFPPSFRCYVDKIIVLDPLGGLPSSARTDKGHVFVNLEQEFEDIKMDLSEPPIETVHGLVTARHDGKEGKDTTLILNRHLRPSAKTQARDIAVDRKRSEVRLTEKLESLDRHRKNLELIQKCLSFLPASSSALLTNPVEAATFPSSREISPDLGVATRRPRNPLIFNLLTDKPLVSSSLPAARLKSGSVSGQAKSQSTPVSFFKKGMAVTMIPDPRTEKWTPPDSHSHFMSLEDPRIDFARLLNLIEDSFSRKLDVKHYINRIRNKIAGIIVAGEYEGGAILTWELPPGVPDDGSPESRNRMVPYLDKFAVLKRSQGAGGVADIVFSAMVRTCFPDGVCWRSRKNNPVNKWYFERSIGTWKLPGAEWSMFWTTPNLTTDEKLFRDYEAVCRSVEPSWADKKHILD